MKKKIISYRVVSKVVTSSIDDARRHRRWRKVIDFCYKDRIEHIEYRVLLALRHVGAITSYEIPYRLLLTRTPQAIDIIRSTGKSVYSVKYFVNCSESHINKRHLIAIYGFYKDEVHSLLDKILAQKKPYKIKSRYVVIRCEDEGENDTASLFYRLRAKIKGKTHTEIIEHLLDRGIAFTPMDALLFFDIPRAPLQINLLRKKGYVIKTQRIRYKSPISGAIKPTCLYEIVR